MTDNVLVTIRNKMDEFSKSQKLIADYIVNHYEKAAYMTALKLATAVTVSESTVVRFANELGFEGYPELQKELREIIKNTLTGTQRIEVATDRIGTEGILSKVMHQDIDRIKHTIAENSEDDFEVAIDKIIASKRIYILGVMSSNVLARFLDYYFQLIFDNVIFVQSANTGGLFQQMIRVNKDDTLISISFPRYSQATLKATKYAHECGTNVIAITDNYNSPLAKYADQILLARSDMSSFVDSLVAPLSVINALIIGVGLRKKESLTDTFDKLERLWEENNAYEKDV